MKKIYGLLFFVVSFAAHATSSNATPAFKDGDIILQTSTSSQSKAIQLATHSKFSHVGIIVYRSGTPYVYEARGPVGYRSLSAFISSGSGKKYLVRRLKGGLTTTQLSKLKTAAAKFASKPYDIYFGWADDRIYCSELVWKVYSRGIGATVGALEELGDFDLSSPEVQKILRERYGNNIPYGETVVSPASIASSSALTTIYSNY